MNKLTIAIIANNEENNIRDVIASASFAGEIVVVDSMSEDKTALIAESLGARVFQRAFDNFSNQRNFAIDQASNDWILFLDADERVSEKLKPSVISALTGTHNFVAFNIKRDNYFMDKKMRFGGSAGDKVLRLFNKKFCRYGSELVHERIYANGAIGELAGAIIHNTYSGGLDAYLKKINLYTTLIARQKNPSKNKNISLFFIIAKMKVRFLKFYILKLGFLDGKVGFIVAFLSAWDSFLRSVKMWRISEGEDF